MGFLCYEFLAKTLIISGEASRLRLEVETGIQITDHRAEFVTVFTDGSVAGEGNAWEITSQSQELLDLTIASMEKPQVKGGYVYVAAPAKLESGLASGWILGRITIGSALRQAALLTMGGCLLLWLVILGTLQLLYRSLRNSVFDHIADVEAAFELDGLGSGQSVPEILRGSLDGLRKKFFEWELRLLESDSLASIAKGTSNGAFICNDKGEVEWVNQALADLMKCDRRELIGCSPIECLNSGYNDPLQLAALEGALKGHRSIELEVYLNSGDSERPVWASLELQPIECVGGEVKRFSGILIDITEKKKALDELEEVSRRFALAMESSNIGVWEWNVKHDRLIWDERMFSLYGINAGGFDSNFSSWMKHIDPDYRNRTTRIVEQCLAKKSNIELVTRMLRPDGEEVFVRHVGRAFYNENGDVLRYLGIALDVTAQHLAERDLTEQKDEAENLAIRLADAVKQSKKAAAEAYQATRAKSAFLAMMSHEIRTPMNGVIGMASLLLETELDEYQRDYLNTIRTSGDTLLTLINDILDYSKIESGKLDIEKAPFCLRECVEDSVDLLVSKAAEKNLELICKFDLNTPETIVGDTTRLKQILVNLLGNAIKFTEFGEVEVCVHPPEEGRLKFSVRDTGIGIPKDRMHRLFEVFSQVDSSTTRKYGGSGLGLSISKQLTELMGGKMWVESAVGKGSVFYFTIEVTDLENLSVDPLFQAQEDLKGRNVLIAERCFVLRDYLRTVCTAWGMNPIAVAGIEELANLDKGESSFSVAICGESRETEQKSESDLISDFGIKNSDVVIKMLRHGSPFEKEPRLSSIYKPCRLGTLLDVIRSGIGSPKVPRSSSIAKATERDDAYAHRLPLRILVADDNSVNQKVARMMLKKFGYNCDLVANGVEAVEAVKQRDYDLIFMDCQMPEMDGFEATRMIRDLESDRRGTKVSYIFALTANVREESLDRSKKVGMNGFLAKPIKLGDIKQALDEVASEFAARN